jgi:beta-phosphoglucomutase-like phosphatase (HAD superfamily)
MQQRMQQRSAFAALAEPWQDEASDSTQQLQEVRPNLQQQQQQAAESHLRRRHLPPVPSVEEVRQQLRSQGGAGCSSAGSAPRQAQLPTTDDGALDWRHLVAALRSGQQARPAPGDVLTDTFQ